MSHIPFSKKAITLLLSLALSGFSAFAEWHPGLRCGFHMNGGNDYQSAPIWTGFALDTVAATNGSIGVVNETTPVVTNGANTSVWASKRVWYYWGEIYLEAGDVVFGGGIDDYIELKIDNSVVFSTEVCKTATETIHFEEAGWHGFSLKLGDIGGFAGPVRQSGIQNGFGFAIKENGATTWSYPADDGTMIRYRYDDGLGFGDTLHVGAYPHFIGTPNPPYGRCSGLTPSSPFTVSAGDSVSTATTNAICTGYVLSNLVDGAYLSIGQGEESSFTYTHNGRNTYLTWLWKLRYALNLSAGTGGVIAPVPEWAERGMKITLGAIPSPGYSFLKWEGDLPPSHCLDPNPVLVVDSTKTAKALFGKNIYVSPAGSDSYDGSSFDSAFATLPAAIAAAQDGQVIELAPGVYPQTETITIDKALTIVGTGDSPEDVVVKRGKGDHRVFVLNHPDAMLRHLAVSDGIGKGNPGANVCIEENGGSVIDCVLRNGYSHWNGWSAGVYVASDAGLVRNCVISNNFAKDYNHNGGVAVGMTAGRVENCLIVKNGIDPSIRFKPNNKAMSIVRMAGGSLLNCTIVDNWLYNTAGVYVESPDAFVANCLIYGNHSISGDADVYALKGATRDVFVACATDGEEAINGTCLLLEGDPNFVDSVHGDYRLAAGSACIDAGILPVGGLSTTDLDGQPRLNNGVPDIGAYELQAPESLTAGLRIPAGRLAKTNESVVFLPSVMRASGAVHFDFDFGDGQHLSATDDLAVEHSYDQPGIYTVTLTATGSTGLSSVSLKLYVIDDTIRVVNGNPNAAEPYATWETAAPDLATAYGFAQDGSDILVSNGTYKVSAGLLLFKGVGIYGLTGNPADVVFCENIEFKSGGFFLLLNPRNVLSGLMLREHSTGLCYGGGAGMMASGATITNCHFYKTKCYVQNAMGSAVVMDKPGLISRCVFEECDVDDNGAKGGTVVMRADGLVENCLFLRNKTALQLSIAGRENQKAAAGVYMTAGVLRNCSFIGNRSLNVGGVYLTGGVVTNCLFAGNTSEGSKGCPTATVFDGDPAAFYHCAADTVLINENCFQGNVEFEDAANRKFAPGFASVAFGNGAIEERDLLATDLAGNSRVSSDGKMDIGCYEKVVAGLGCSFLVSGTQGGLPFTTTFTPSLPTVSDPSTVQCKWDFGDGQTATDDGATPVSHTYQTLGDFTVTLTASDGMETAVSVQEKVISVRPATIYVSVGNEGAAEPYDTEATAAKDIATAVDFAIDGCEIVILPGEYILGNQVIVEKGLEIRSKTGRPEDVLVKRKSGVSTRLFLLNHPLASLSGVTLESGKLGGGATHNLGGANLLILGDGGIASNCVFRGGDSWAHGGAGAAVRSSKGLITHCVITNNCSFDCNFAGGAGIFLTEGKVRDCLRAGNYYEKGNGGAGWGGALLRGGSLVNCTVVDNRVQNCGGVTCEAGGVTNCVIVRNEATKTTDPAKVVYGAKNPGSFVSCISDIVKINDACLQGDAGFVEAENGYYHLVAGSPCIDAGSMALPDSFAKTDLDGNIRVQHHVIDIGCYEHRYVTPALMLMVR